MKETSLAIILIALILGFAHKQSPGPTPTVTPIPTAAPSPLVTPTPIPGTKIITLKCDSSCTPAEVLELPQIEALMNSTFMSDCFYKYFVGRKRIDLAQGFTGAQIVGILRTPSNLTLNYYNNSNTRVDGYEDSADFSTIHFNRTALKANGFNLCDKASLGGHELSHTKKFFHNGNLASPNYYTVPYTVNHAFDTGSDFGGCCK